MGIRVRAGRTANAWLNKGTQYEEAIDEQFVADSTRWLARFCLGQI